MPAEDYEIEARPIAQGAQGSVYIGVRRADGLPVAIKVPGRGKSLLQALLREMEVLRALEDAGVAGVVQVLEGIRFNERPAMVMPHYPQHMGDWLGRVIAQPNAGTLDDVLARLSGLCRALAGVHRLSYGGGTVVHRDIKPENVFLDREGQPHLGDFGGAMAIEGLKAVELALFGTPMWAPLDQMLPGQAIPDPTWDTYAVCGMLYAGLTGARPAYQADPRELLTPRGRELWDAARMAIEGPPEERRRWHTTFARMRTGTTSEDLVDLTGRAALLDSDREALDNGIRHLGQLASLDDERIKLISRRIWAILVRGLSPLSHPSPPNRFRDGDELADSLDDLREILRAGAAGRAEDARANERLRELMNQVDTDVPTPARSVQSPPPRRALRSGIGIVVVSVGLMCSGLGLTGLALWQREAIFDALAPWMPSEPVVRIEGPDGAFLIDSLEVTNGDCVASGVCPPNSYPPDIPAVQVTARQAARYCVAAGGRLPRASEWRAAAGPQTFPWGEETPTCAHAVALGCGEGVMAVGTTPRGRSPHGLYDMAGNVWEWAVQPDGTAVLLGGAADSTASELGAKATRTPRKGAPPGLFGFRCAYDADPR